MEVTVSRTLSAYMLDRLTDRSAIASLLFKKTMSWSRMRRYRTSVPFKELQKHHDVEGLESVP